MDDGEGSPQAGGGLCQPPWGTAHPWGPHYPSPGTEGSWSTERSIIPSPLLPVAFSPLSLSPQVDAGSGEQDDPFGRCRWLQLGQR